MLFHNLDFPAYSNLVVDGQVIRTYAANLTVRVTNRGDDIWFNDAKVIAPNVLTNNGLIHVLHRIMSPLESNAPTSKSGTTAPTASSTSSPAASSSRAAAVGGFQGSQVQTGVVAFLAAVFFL
jgi:hypothetical protein